MKLIRNSILACMGAALLFACAKEANLEPQSGESASITQTNSSSVSNPDKKNDGYDKTAGDYKTGFKELKGEGENMRCEGKDGNCIDTYVVEGLAAPSFVDFTNAVSSGSEAVGDYFTGNNWQEIFDYLPEEELLKLQSYDYDLVELEGQGEHIRYFFAGLPHQGEVGLENHEFIITLDDSQL